MNIQLEPHALTPYFYPLITLNTSMCSQEESPNYNEYNLFCLQTRLRPVLEKLGLAHASINYVPVQRGPRFYIGVMLSDAGLRISLTQHQKNELDNKIRYITTINVTSCLLFSSSTQIWVGNKYIPNLWILSILHYLPVDSTLNPYVNEMDLYVDLSKFADYNQRYELLYKQIIIQLQWYYQAGAVVCNANFAEQWGLVAQILVGLKKIRDQGDALEDDLIGELTDDIGVYVPKWQDIRFAPDRVTFLTDRMAGQKIYPLNLLVEWKEDDLNDYQHIVVDGNIVLVGDYSLNQLKQLVERLSK